MTRRLPLVLSALALFVALGGPAAAEDAVVSAKKKITGKRIAKNAITSRHVKNGTIKAADLAAGVVPGPVDAFTKAESDARFQPRGDYLPASAAGAFASGVGRGFHTTIDPRIGDTDTEVLEIPGMARAELQCFDDSPADATLVFTALGDWDLLIDDDPSGGYISMDPGPGEERVYEHQISLRRHITLAREGTVLEVDVRSNGGSHACDVSLFASGVSE